MVNKSMTSFSASVSLKVLRQEGRGATTHYVRGDGTQSAFMLRKMCIILDKLGTAVLATPIFLTHTAMLYLIYKNLVYIRAGSTVKN